MKLFDRLLDKRLAAYQRELIEIHYAEVENMYRQMRGWRHDYRSHIQTMKAHAAEGDWEAVRAYLDTLETDLATVDTVVKTGNPMADAILNSKISLARSKGIPVQADASIPVALKISELDLCVILGNLIDNAMESCEKVEEGQRFLRLYIGVLKQQLYLSISNATTETVRKIDAAYISTKRGNHGHGLKRIDRVVEKYGGYVNRQNEPGVFATEILLPL